MPLNLAADQSIFFADFAELGKVTPVGRWTRSVSMLIYRQRPESQADNGARIRSMHISLKNSSTEGLTADESLQEIDGDVATVTFPESVGDAEPDWVTKPINRIVKQNAGMILVEVTT